MSSTAMDPALRVILVVVSASPAEQGTTCHAMRMVEKQRSRYTNAVGSFTCESYILFFLGAPGPCCN